MSKKKSLGSSPIAFKSQKSAMGFIPDRGVSANKEETNTASKARKTGRDKSSDNATSQKDNKKKIVSYYLEIDLIEKVKTMADRKDMYYSSLVTSALKYWIAENN